MQSGVAECSTLICHTNGTTQYNTTQRSTAQHSTAQHSTAQHSTAQHSTAQHSTAQHSTAQHSTAQHSTAQHSTAQHSSNTAQHKLDVDTFLLENRFQNQLSETGTSGVSVIQYRTRGCFAFSRSLYDIDLSSVPISNLILRL